MYTECYACLYLKCSNTKSANQSISQTVIQSVSQSMDQSVSRSVRQLISLSIDQSVSHSVSQSVSGSVINDVCVVQCKMTYQRRMQECEESKNDYASQLQATNKYQHEYYTAHMPTVFKVTLHYINYKYCFFKCQLQNMIQHCIFSLGPIQNILSPILILMFVFN